MKLIEFYESELDFLVKEYKLEKTIELRSNKFKKE